MARRKAVTSQAVSVPLPAAREARIKPDQMHSVPISASQPLRREALFNPALVVMLGNISDAALESDMIWTGVAKGKSKGKGGQLKSGA
jgi:hypothetical protein